MLRDLSRIAANGNGILGTYLVGLPAEELATGFALPGLLENDISDSDPAGCLYREEIVDWPIVGDLQIEETGALSFTGAPDGAYTGATIVYKNDVPDSGSYTFAIGEAVPSAVVTGVTITPSAVALDGGATQQFDATVEGPGVSQAVTWDCDLGTVDSDGMYTAPAPTSSVQTAHVTATSDADPGFSATATVTISAVHVTPTPIASSRHGRGRARSRGR